MFYNIFLFFGGDVGTDLKFTVNMADNVIANDSNVKNITCRTTFREQFQNTTNICDDSFEIGECKNALLKSLDILQSEDCTENSNRFSNRNEWYLIFQIGLVHLMMPFIVAFITWVVIEQGRWSKTSIFRLPIPIFTVPYKFYYDKQMIEIMATPDRDDNEETRKKYEKAKEAVQKKLDSLETTVNLSKIVESAVESRFQFFYQTVFIFPSIVLSVTADAGGGDWRKLVNWRSLSILLSFTSFAWNYYTIR